MRRAALAAWPRPGPVNARKRRFPLGSLANREAADLQLPDLKAADLRPADREAPDAEPTDREAADRRRAHREGADRRGTGRRRRPRLRAEECDCGELLPPANRSAATLPPPCPPCSSSYTRPGRGRTGSSTRSASRPRCAIVEPLAGEPLPDHDEVDGVVAMGGPMNVDDLERHPALAAEREWLAEAVRLPYAGARHLPRGPAPRPRPGRRGEAGRSAEIGFAHGRRARPPRPDPRRPRTGDNRISLASATSSSCPTAHGSLASSAQTEHQAFRYGNAWGVLFHPEADAAWSRPGWGCQRW